MKVAYSSILELPKRANKKADVKKVSFHPTEPYAFLATDEDVLGSYSFFHTFHVPIMI
jgi:hypothetical protein